jgi:SAM-dependent methyltransferase
MTALAERLREKYFGHAEHPYVRFEKEVARRLRPEHVLLDAGCGRTAPVLTKYRGLAQRLIGVDLVEFDRAAAPDVELIAGNLSSIALPDGSVDVIMARSVLEHLDEPAASYREMWRLLKPGGHFIFLTANLWDYVSLIAALVPNRWHPWVVSKTEGREQHDVFPIRYRTNTRGAVYRFAERTGFDVTTFEYLGQYPAYFMFNGALFFLATGYEKLVSRFDSLAWLRGWIFAVLTKRSAHR